MRLTRKNIAKNSSLSRLLNWTVTVQASRPSSSRSSHHMSVGSVTSRWLEIVSPRSSRESGGNPAYQLSRRISFSKSALFTKYKRLTVELQRGRDFGAENVTSPGSDAFHIASVARAPSTWWLTSQLPYAMCSCFKICNRYFQTQPWRQSKRQARTFGGKEKARLVKSCYQSLPRETHVGYWSRRERSLSRSKHSASWRYWRKQYDGWKFSRCCHRLWKSSRGSPSFLEPTLWRSSRNISVFRRNFRKRWNYWRKPRKKPRKKPLKPLPIRMQRTGTTQKRTRSNKTKTNQLTSNAVKETPWISKWLSWVNRLSIR